MRHIRLRSYTIDERTGTLQFSALSLSPVKGAAQGTLQRPENTTEHGLVWLGLQKMNSLPQYVTGYIGKSPTERRRVLPKWCLSPAVWTGVILVLLITSLSRRVDRRYTGAHIPPPSCGQALYWCS